MLDYFLHPEKFSIFDREQELTSNTVIVPLAFGRNTWNDDEVSKNLAPYMFQIGNRNMDHERFNFLLEMDDFNPGCVNQRLAEICYELATKNQIGSMPPYRVYGQWEVMYALYHLYKDWYKAHPRGFLRALWPDTRRGEYFSTRALLEILPLGPEQKIAVVAQGVHLARCLRVADQVFSREAVTKAPAEMPNFYNSQSTQPWTRDHANFIAHEKQARIFEELPAPARWLARKILKLLGK